MIEKEGEEIIKNSHQFETVERVELANLAVLEARERAGLRPVVA